MQTPMPIMHGWMGMICQRVERNPGSDQKTQHTELSTASPSFPVQHFEGALHVQFSAVYNGGLDGAMADGQVSRRQFESKSLLRSV